MNNNISKAHKRKRIETDVLMIYPPEDYDSGTFHRDMQLSIGGIPLGILHVASHLNANGVKTEIYDSRLDFDLDLIETHVSGTPFRFGADESLIETKIKEIKPRIVGVSNLFLTRIHESYRICEIVKKISPDTFVVMGGASCSILKLEIFRNCQGIDAVVFGEGENVFLELANRVLSGKSLEGIPSLAYRRGDEIFYDDLNPSIVEDLSTLAEPDYSLLDMEKYFKLLEKNFLPRLSWFGDELERAVSITTSRGCPYKCVFCTRRLHNTSKWRAETPEKIVGRIEFLRKQYGITHFYIEDDSVNIRKDRFERILDLLIEKNLGVTWSSPNGIRGEGLTVDIIQKCIDSGCISLQVGIESGDQSILDRVVKKRLDLSEVQKGIRNCHKKKLDVGAFFIIGFPGEKKQNIFKTIALMLKLNILYGCRVHLAIASPMKGSELYDLCLQGGYLREVHSNWSLTDFLLGKPPERKSLTVIGTEDFTYNFLKVCHTLILSLSFFFLISRSVLALLIKPQRVLTISKKVRSRNKRAYIKTLVFRCLPFPKMLSRL